MIGLASVQIWKRCLHVPGVRAVWLLISNRSNRDFRSHIDELLRRVPIEAA